jgi:hypothetical protein
LRIGDAPLDPRNRCVSVIVEYLYATSGLSVGVRELAAPAQTRGVEEPSPR